MLTFEYNDVQPNSNLITVDVSDAQSERNAELKCVLVTYVHPFANCVFIANKFNLAKFQSIQISFTDRNEHGNVVFLTERVW